MKKILGNIFLRTNEIYFECKKISEKEEF